MSHALVTYKVAATIGFCNSGVAARSLEVYPTATLPPNIPCATGSPLTAKYPGPESFIFRASAKGAAKGAAEGAVRAQTFIAEPSNERRASFLTCYARKYKVTKFPVPMAAAQGYDAVTFANPEDAMRNLFVQRKQ